MSTERPSSMCPRCKSEPWLSSEPCGNCDGEGSVPDPHDNNFDEPCLECGGTGACEEVVCECHFSEGNDEP